MALGQAYGDGFVGIANSVGVSYIRGDALTVGGLRLAGDIGDSLPRVERNIAGTWTNQGTFPGGSSSSLDIEFETYFLGE